jgi:chromosome partitioning protein
MKVIVLASQKGGVGKTTLTGHLGVQVALSGQGPVALLDTDPQGSLADWWNARELAEPVFATAKISALTDAMADLKKAGIKTLLIDTPPAVTETIRAVVAVADLVIIPTRPSPHDLRAVGKTVDIVTGCGKRMMFVINGAAHRARITADAAIALSQHGAVAPTVVYQRTDFASSMIDGRTAGEIDPQGRSANEIAELWNYVNTLLHKSVSKRN